MKKNIGTAVLGKVAMLFSISQFFLSPTHGEVDQDTGNLSMFYLDVATPNSLGVRMKRVYNSNSTKKGIFGWGWGSEAETKLWPLPEGGVVVREYGNGADHYYYPKDMSADALTKSLNDLVEGGRKKISMSGIQVQQYRKALEVDPVFRAEEWKKNSDVIKASSTENKIGNAYLSKQFGYSYCTRVKDGYLRVIDDERIEKFDQSGRLIQLADRSGKVMQFTFGADGTLSKAVDSFRHSLSFQFNHDHLLEKIETEEHKVVQYHYSSRSDLTEATNLLGEKYKYDYDPHHNLTQIQYFGQNDSQHGKTDIIYYGSDSLNRVKSVNDQMGARYSYQYSRDGSSAQHTSVQVTKEIGDQIEKKTIDIFRENSPAGNNRIVKKVETKNGNRIESYFDPCCEGPVRTIQGKNDVQFKYDQRGRVSEKSSPFEKLQYDYDSMTGKLIQFKRTSVTKPTNEKSFKFEYSPKGSLSSVGVNGKNYLRLVYDESEKVRYILTEGQGKLELKYNSDFKVSELSDPRLGVVTLEYTSSGQIKKMSSLKGDQVMKKIVDVVKSAQELIEPTGLSLKL